MNLFSDKLRELTPYVPGEQPRDGAYIKLNTNENPYPPSPKVFEAISEATSRLRLYPDPESTELRDAYAELVGLQRENVFVGNGSDEVLATAFQAFFEGKSNVLMPDITYSFYPVYCNMYNVKALEIPVREDMTVDPHMYVDQSMDSNIDPNGKPLNSGVIIANPNAPTSIALGLSDIEEIVKSNKDSVVLIDEAYVDFGGESAVSLINRYNNLLVVSTLSKSRSLAGLRVGFAAGSPELISAMDTVKNSFNSYPVDVLAQKGARAALLDREYFEETTAKIIKTREWTKEQLLNLGFNVLESKANFLFIEHRECQAKDIFQTLKEKKILVRYFDKPRIDNYLRVTIGTDEEMEEFVRVLERMISN